MTTSAALVVGVGVALTLAVAGLLWVRPADRRVAAMLVLLAGAYAVRGLAASDSAWVFTAARALGQVAELVLVWVMLAFPSGRLRSRTDRILVGCAAIVSTAVWFSALLFAPTAPLPGPLVRCGDGCPDNPLLIADRPELAHAFESGFRVASVLLLAAVACSLLGRLLSASPTVRRTLAPLLIVSILRVLAVAVFVASGGSWLSGFALVLTFWAVPVAMAVGLLLGRLYSARSLFRLVSGLDQRPEPAALRTVMADALEDPLLEVWSWLPERRRWVDADGVLSTLSPVPVAGREVTLIAGAHGPVAAIVHDQALLEMPALLEAVVASARIALVTHPRVAEVEARTRREVERDLHDGTQQRLIALQMKVSVLRRLLDTDVRRADDLAAQIGSDVKATLAEVRRVAHGDGRPPGLSVGGLVPALAELADRAGVPVETVIDGIGRYRSEVESAVYYTCSEAVQNAAKHGGPDVQVRIVLREAEGQLRIEISDNGTGRGEREAAPTSGRGLANMADRMVERGGWLEVVAGAAAGTVVRGALPTGEGTPETRTPMAGSLAYPPDSRR